MGRNGHCLSGQGDGCGDGRFFACGGQGDSIVNGRLLAFGGDHVLVGWSVPVVFFDGFYPLVHVLMMYVEQLGT